MPKNESAAVTREAAVTTTEAVDQRAVDRAAEEARQAAIVAAVARASAPEPAPVVEEES